MLFCFLFLRKYLYISSYRGQSLKYKLISYYVSLVLFKSIRIILFDNSAKENKVILKTFFFFFEIETSVLLEETLNITINFFFFLLESKRGKKIILLKSNHCVWQIKDIFSILDVYFFLNFQCIYLCFQSHYEMCATQG